MYVYVFSRMHVFLCVLICVHMQTSDVSAELSSPAPSVELLSDSLSLLRKEEQQVLFLFAATLL